MRHIKSIDEAYTEEDLLDLWGDLNDLGFVKLQGWVFSWDSKSEEPLMEIMVSGSPRAALEMYKTHGYFGADVGYAQKEGKKFNKLDEVFKFLQKDGVVTSYEFVWGLNTLDEIKEQAFLSVNNSNPFIVVDLLNQYFDNGAERYRREYNSKVSKVRL